MTNSLPGSLLVFGIFDHICKTIPTQNYRTSFRQKNTLRVKLLKLNSIGCVN